MKYQTIVFDVNKPTLKQVKVPLESDYGMVGTEDAGFELRVQEQDLGYIEPAVLTGYGQA